MKQVIESLRDGRIEVIDVPSPVLQSGGVLVRTACSVISPGTERMVMELARKSLLGKAQERPDLVQKVLAKLRRDGLAATLRTVRDRLDGCMPLGYSAAGEVIEAGDGAKEFACGEPVACAGVGFANHAEVNYVPRLLAVRVPRGVSDEAAAYATVGAIALQGIRNAEVHPGETVVVIGLGLLGLLAVQLLKASGCRAVGLDVQPERVEMARSFEADLAMAASDASVEGKLFELTRGRGADAVLICAATASHAPIELAARLARDRACVVMVGVTGMNVPRRPYFQKELRLVVSRSYGPGRYDREFEQAGHDYPAGYVRWTETRNIEAFLDLAAAGRIHPERCTTHRFCVADARMAFDLVLENREPALGVVLLYPRAKPAGDEPSRIVLRENMAAPPVARVGISLLGGGEFARAVLLPAVKRLPGVELRGIVTASGLSARRVGDRCGFAFCSSREADLLEDPQTHAVIVVTRHADHAAAVCRAIEAGKTVFVEKPLAISLEQLGAIRKAMDAHQGRLMVGFNRRFAPLASELKAFVRDAGPLMMSYRCNAGSVPEEHWIADPDQGGRILGEACHFVDVLAFLTGASPRVVYASAAGKRGDDAVIAVSYEDGSQGQILYTSEGASSLGKERIEVFGGGRAAVLEDFRRLELRGGDGKTQRRRHFQADKGHAAQMAAFVRSVASGGAMPIAAKSLVETTLVGLATMRSICQGRAVAIAELMDEIG